MNSEIGRMTMEDVEGSPCPKNSVYVNSLAERDAAGM